MNRNIILSVAIAFGLAFSVFFVFQTHFQHLQNAREEQFFSQKFDPNVKRIFILGSSQTGQINATWVNELISKHDKTSYVYNLSHTADTPIKRENMLNSIISSKPSLIVYGIGYRDFQSILDKHTILPDPHQLFQQVLSEQELIHFDNPKLITLNAIRDLSTKNSVFVKPIFSDNTPFYPAQPDLEIIHDDVELKNNIIANQTMEYIDPVNQNKQLMALDTIISKLKTNNIKVVILIVPHQRFYIDSLSLEELQTFDSIVQHVSEKDNVTIYNYDTKYSDLSIWADVTHVAGNKNSLIFSTDVAKIIMDEK